MNKILLNDTFFLIVFSFIVAFGFWALTGVLFEPETALDDAFITLHNAQLLAGDRIATAFDEGGALVGSTSLLHTCLIALAIVAGLPALSALSAVTLFNASLYLVGLSLLINSFALSRVYKAGFVLIGFFLALAPYQLANGLETGLAMAAVTWGIFCFRVGGLYRGLLLPAIIGLMPIIRPELLALSGLFGLALLYEKWQAEPVLKALILRALGIGIIAIIVLVPFAIVLYVDSGSILPNTIGAKKYFFAEGCLPFLQRLALFAKSILLFVGPMAVALLFIRPLVHETLGRSLTVFLLVFVFAYLINMPGSIAHNMSRYSYVLFPVFVYGGLIYLRNKQTEGQKPVLFFAVLIQLIVLNLGANVFLAKQHKVFVVNNHIGTTDWLRENTSEGDTLLVHDVGYLGFALENRKVIDMVGLKTKEIAQYHQRITWASCGKDRALAINEIVKNYDVDYLVAFTWWDDDFKLSEALSEVVNVEEVQRPVANPNGYYKVFRLSPK